jgi:F0F1-type ATP synthase assembly protein I
MAADPTSRTQDVHDSLHRSHGSFELALAPVLMALIGLWIDRMAGTTPIVTIVLAVMGVLGAFAKLYYSYRNQMAELDAKAAWREPGATRS